MRTEIHDDGLSIKRSRNEVMVNDRQYPRSMHHRLHSTELSSGFSRPTGGMRKRLAAKTFEDQDLWFSSSAILSANTPRFHGYLQARTIADMR